MYGGTTAGFRCLCIGIALTVALPLAAQSKSSLTVKQSSGVGAATATPAPPVPPVPPSPPRVSSQPAGVDRNGMADVEHRLRSLETFVNAMRADIARSTEIGRAHV